MRQCVIEGCGSVHLAKGLCRAHYLRKYRHGDTEDARKAAPLAERFWRHVNQGTPDECWLWKGDPGQYGVITNDKGRNTGAHRASYEIHKGKIPPFLIVMHQCDTPLCVNPNHLRLGTPKENMDDMDAKGRRVPAAARGESHPTSILTETDVRFIRDNPHLGLSDLGRKYGVSHNTIRAVRIRRSWRHVT